MKSFQLATDEDRFKTHAFVSFKTDPDEPLAKDVANFLRTDDLKVTLIHGDSECPYEFGSADAEKWIRNLLDTRVNESRILLSIASSASLRSEWVFQEFYSATQSCRLVLLLWFNGSDPTEHFVPAPRFVARRLPSCPVYLVDCRSERDARLNDLATILRSLPSMNRSLVARRCLWALGSFAIFVGPLAAVLFAFQPSDDQFHNAQMSQKLKQAAELWLLVVIAAAATFAPASLRVPNVLLNTRKIFLIVPGFGVLRYVVIVMFLLALGAGMPMNNVWVWLAIGVPSVVIVSIISRILRQRLVSNSYKKRQSDR